MTFHQTFFEEAADLIADLEGLLLRLEESPNDTDLLNNIFRCAHSIKGGSATFGFADIAHLGKSVSRALWRNCCWSRSINSRRCWRSRVALRRPLPTPRP